MVQYVFCYVLRIQIPAQVLAVDLFFGKPITQELEAVPRSVPNFEVLVPGGLQHFAPVHKGAWVLRRYFSVLSPLIVP